MKINCIVENLRFPESPVWSQERSCLFLVEMDGDTVLSLQNDVISVQFPVEPGGGPSGLCIDSRGDIWVCLYSACKVARYNLAGKLLQVFQNYQGVAFRGACDMVADAWGGVYFTDSGDFDDDWRSGRPVGAVYYISSQGELFQVDREIAFPNGIALSPDGKILYVDEHRRNRILAYHLRNHTSFQKKTILTDLDTHSLLPEESGFELGPDGLCVGTDGSLWVAHYGGGKLVHISASGEQLGAISLPRGRMPSSAAFGQDPYTLYVTEAEYGLLYRILLDQ